MSNPKLIKVDYKELPDLPSLDTIGKSVRRLIRHMEDEKLRVLRAAFTKLSIPWTDEGFGMVLRKVYNTSDQLEEYVLFHGTEHEFVFCRFWYDPPPKSGLQCESV